MEPSDIWLERINISDVILRLELDEKRYLLHELRIQNDKELEEKQNLDSKATNISNFSITFAVLLFGFGSFLLEKLRKSDSSTFGFMELLLISGVIFSIICLIASVMAYRVRSYRYTMSYENFFLTEDSPTQPDQWKNHLNENEIASWISDFSGDDSQEKYEDFMIKEHVVALRNNTIINNYKANWIRKAQILFIVAVCFIPVILLSIWVGFIMGLIRIAS